MSDNCRYHACTTLSLIMPTSKAHMSKVQWHNDHICDMCAIDVQYI